MIAERLGDAAREPRHVLIVFENGNPLAVLVRRDTFKPLEHFIPLYAQTTFGRVRVGKNIAPYRMGVQHRAGSAKADDRKVQQGFSGRLASAFEHIAFAVDL